MVEKQIEFTTLKTSTIELGCGCSRKLKFTNRKEFFMNYKNRRKSHKPCTPKTAPARRELTVSTIVDLFTLREEVNAAYAQHVPTLEVVFTSYHNPESTMLLTEEQIPFVVRLIESCGYELFKDETLLGHISSRRISRYSFAARVGLFPTWPREPEGDDEV